MTSKPVKVLKYKVINCLSLLVTFTAFPIKDKAILNVVELLLGMALKIHKFNFKSVKMPASLKTRSGHKQ